MGFFGFRPYVPVAQRRLRALKEMEKLKKKGRAVSPVTIEGRKIAKSFWGKAWCDNLERYSDFENRLPRGRTYVAQRLGDRPADRARQGRGAGQRLGNLPGEDRHRRRRAGALDGDLPRIAPARSGLWSNSCRASCRRT